MGAFGKPGAPFCIGDLPPKNVKLANPLKREMGHERI